MKKRAIISVINDLVTDRRVDRTAKLLTELGFDVLLIGRRKRDSLQLEKRPYKTKRMKLCFEKGPLFYVFFNTRLLINILFRKADLLFSNDLDTLLPNYIVSRLRKIPLVYDSHEYFTGVPELAGRPFVTRIWGKIEKTILPRLGEMITVNDSIAGLYRNEYGVKVNVVRNMPGKLPNLPDIPKEQLDIPVDKKIILLQGAGINIDRGAEEAIMAMQYLDNAILMVIGGGDVYRKLMALVTELGLNKKVMFFPKQPFDRLMAYTKHADVGLTLDKDSNINYRYSLPNKLFDYIHAGVPVLASQVVEVKKIVERYRVGTFVDNHEPQHIAQRLSEMLNSPEKLALWRENCKKAASELHWLNEKNILKELLEKYA